MSVTSLDDRAADAPRPMSRAEMKVILASASSKISWSLTRA